MTTDTFSIKKTYAIATCLVCLLGGYAFSSLIHECLCSHTSAVGELTYTEAENYALRYSDPEYPCMTITHGMLEALIEADNKYSNCPDGYRIYHGLNGTTQLAMVIPFNLGSDLRIVEWEGSAAEPIKYIESSYSEDGPCPKLCDESWKLIH